MTNYNYISDTKGSPYKTHGITLIALIITIILLLILVGVTIHFTLGENGILRNAEIAVNKYEKSQAREKLQTALAYAEMQKNINKDYNSGEFLEELLAKEGISLVGNTASVDGYTFLIDREKLIIVEEIEEAPTKVQIAKVVTSYLGKKENDKYYVKAEVTIESEEEIESITLEDGTNIEITPNGLTATKEIELEIGRKYKVITITKGGVTNENTLIEEKEEKINNVNELVELRNNVNKGLTYEGKILTQTQDIDLSSVCGISIGNWESIGYVSTNSYFFKGTYNGNGKVISNLYIDNNQDKTEGLFGALGYNGTIKNLTVDGDVKNLEQGRYRGGIVGRNEGIIDNCINNVNVEGTYGGAGGIAGGNFNTVKNCINNANIKNEEITGGIVGDNQYVTDIISTTNKYETVVPIIENCTNSSTAVIEGSSYVGGICGITVNKINNCTNEGTVTAKSSIAGGIVGNSHENITNCKNKGTVTSNGNPEDPVNRQGTGGIAGRISKEVSECSNVGVVSTNGYFAGGIVGLGLSGAKVSKSYNYNGSISTGVNAAGGIVGRGDGITIENCYNYLSSNEYYIKAQGDNAGGVIGIITVETNNTITNCYSIGNNIQSESIYNKSPNVWVGAFAGVIYGSTTITNAFYENTNPLQANSSDSNGKNGEITAKSVEGFKKSEKDTSSVAYLLNGSLTNETWKQNSNINGGYPYLEENKPE